MSEKDQRSSAWPLLYYLDTSFLLFPKPTDKLNHAHFLPILHHKPNLAWGPKSAQNLLT